MAIAPIESFGLVNVRWFGAKGNGTTDDTAAFEAAYDALPDAAGGVPGGGTIIVPPGRYPVHQLTLDRGKPVIMRTLGERPLRRINNAEKGAKGVATLIGLDTGDDSRVISITSGTGNGYGFAFEGINFDLTVGTQYAIYAEDVNHTVVRNCGATSTDTPPRAQWLVRSLALGTAGSDASWWRIEKNYANRVGLAYIGFTDRNQHNHNLLADNICFPGNQVDACIKIFYGNRNATHTNNLEMGSSTQAVGLYLEHTWGGSHIMDAGESVSGSTFYKVRSSVGNLIMPGGISSPAGSVLIDDRYGHNLLLTPRGNNADSIQDYAASSDVSVTSGFLGANLLGMNGSGLVGAVLSPTPTTLRKDQLSLVEETTDLVALGTITADHLVSGVYTAWSPANLQDIRYPNADGPTITQSDSASRIKVAGLPANVTPLLVATYESSFALPTGATLTVDVLQAGTTTKITQRVLAVADGITLRGLSVQLPTITQTFDARLELVVPNWPVGGTIKMPRLELKVRSAGVKNGTVMRGPGTPEGAVTAQVGTMFLRTDGGAGTTLWVKESGAGTNTGWVAK